MYMRRHLGFIEKQMILAILLVVAISKSYAQSDPIPIKEINIKSVNAASKNLKYASDKLKSLLGAESPDTSKITKAKAAYAKANAEKELSENLDKVKFGDNVRVFVSLGPAVSFSKLYDPVLSPIDSSLRLQTLFPVSFILSTGVAVSAKGRKAELIKDSKGSSFDPSNYYRKPSLLSFIANVNLAQFSSGSSSFNQKITGGIGLGIRASDDFYVSITYDINVARQLRDYYIDNYQDKQIPLGKNPRSSVLGNLDSSNNQFFFDSYYSGVSVKFVYVVTGKKID